jgi:TolB-like protein
VLLKQAGAHRLKNIPDPVEVFEVARGSESSVATAGLQWPKLRGRRLFPLAAAALVAVVLGGATAAGLMWRSFGGGGSGAGAKVPSILIMPISANQDRGRNSLLADGLTDEMIGGLTRFSNIRVFGRNTSNSLAKSSDDPRQLMEKHGVNYVVRGAMHDLGEKLRLNVELIDTTTGAVRWASRYEDDVSKAFQTVNEVVENVVSNIATKVTRAELDRARLKPPADLTAFELTLRGRQLWQRPNREALLEARGLFLRAAEVDPNYAPPLAYAAFTHLTAFNNTWSDEFAKPAALQRMLDLASKALDLDPTYALAYAAQAIAYTYQGRHDEADAAVERAFQANPNDPDVLGRVGQVQSFSGKHQQAIGTLKRAIEIDPFGPAQWFNFLSRAHFFLGEDHAAISSARTCLERSKIQPCQETLIAALALSDQRDEALQNWKDVTAKTPNLAPERLVARLRPAFRNQKDLDRLVEGLTKAAAFGS